jgi:hypothetical protein
MRKFFLKHCRAYRKIVKKLFGKYNVEQVHIPWEIYGDFDIHYLGYDESGHVKKGFKTLFEALKNRGNLGLTVLYDKY